MGKLGKIALGTTVVFVGGIWALQAIGSNVESTFAEEDGRNLAVAENSSKVAQPATAAPPIADAAPPSKPEPVRMGDLDEAEKVIRLAINLSGNLCAKPIEVRKVGANLYGVHCITNRDGTGRSNYLVNSRTNEVDKI
ncbi:MAG: hypothetical protein JNM03_11480 [Sphingopyxis sp.]|uniref:hypothetical protein n=1 Tax=Sphingopyxis sp. TaxID=1908224 RepID=UPI001A3DD744|nr:hypothetical protein [Sphingopyxis sp.]MBL9070595.1 hypothetical protein [Sphingopyxis sp.]